jgi:hypothetical protein
VFVVERHLLHGVRDAIIAMAGPNSAHHVRELNVFFITRRKFAVAERDF